MSTGYFNNIIFKQSSVEVTMRLTHNNVVLIVVSRLHKVFISHEVGLTMQPQ